jgi:pimeloyl-ACP methyl ester carboxylesterase
MVATSYGQTFVRISGPEGAPPLVLLPGASSTSLMWIPNIRPWSEHFRTYAVDNIYDYGRSIYTRAMRRPDDFVAWLDELFVGLGLGNRINLIGMSYGGWLAGLYALRFQDRLDKVVLLAPARTVLPLRLAFMVRVILTLLPHRCFTRMFMDWIFKGLAERDEKTRLVFEEVVDDTFMASRCFKGKRFIQPTVLTDKELQSIRAPLLYVVGENERIYSALRAVERLKRVAPRIETKIIPNAGHALTVEQADTVNSMVLEFLRR